VHAGKQLGAAIWTKQYITSLHSLC